MTELPRRDVLCVGGLAIGFGALAAACSSGDDPAPEVADEVESTTEVADPASAEVALLNTSLSLEVLVFDTYQMGLDSALVQSAEVVDAARSLQQHHAEHRDTLIALVESLDGEPFTTANPVVKVGVVDPTLAAVAVEGDFIRLAHDLEQACAQLYVHAATALGTPELRRTVMSIAAVAGRRAAVLDLLGDLGNERFASYPTANPLPSDAMVPR